MAGLSTEANSQGHVLLVDDDVELCESISHVLRFAGYEVQSWNSAADFLVSVPRLAPAVLITDMRMPGMTGVELHDELQQRGHAFPVIYISGESTVQQSIKAMKLGAFDFLIKPFSREDLLRVAAAAVEKDRLQMLELIRKARYEEARARLSPRETEVHDLLLKGFGNREIVDALGISLPTAKQYKSEVMRKLGVRSLAELMAFSRSTETTPS